MEVQTYEEVEVTENGADLEPEQVQLIEKLGLEGQLSRIAEADDGTKTLNPYRRMAAEEKEVYDILLPTTDKVEDYKSGPIPTRVLQVIAHARECDLGKLYVQHSADAIEPDPLLIARTGQYGSEYWLLARWGDVLEPFDKLVARAFERAKEKATATYEAMRPLVEQRLAAVTAARNLKTLNKIGTSISGYETGIE